jgi:hypothetical protein
MSSTRRIVWLALIALTTIALAHSLEDAPPIESAPPTQRIDVMRGGVVLLVAGVLVLCIVPPIFVVI